VGDLREVVRAPLDGPPPCDRRRVLFLGDSFTYGYGVQDEGRTFPAILSALLRDRENHPVATFNGGIPGSHTVDWLRLLDRAEPLLQPDLTVVVFFLRDGQRAATNVGQLRKVRADLRALVADDDLAGTSALWRFLVTRGAQQRLGLEHLRVIAQGYVGTPAQRQEWKRAQLDLLEARATVAARGGRLVVVVFPVLFGLRGGYPLQAVVDAVLASCQAHGLPALSLLDAFRGRDGPPLWVASDDAHPNQEAHALAAQAMLPFITHHLHRAGRSTCAGEPPHHQPAWPSAPLPLPENTPPPVARLLTQVERSPGSVRQVPPEHLPVFARFVSHPVLGPEVLDVLEGLGPGAAPALPALLDALGDRHVPRNHRILRVVGNAGEAAVPALREALVLRRGHGVEALEAAGAVGWRGAALAPVAARLLVSTDSPGVTRAALRALGAMGPAAAGEVASRLDGATPLARARLLRALGHVGPHLPPRWTGEVARALEDPDPQVRVAAAMALWQAVPASRDAREALERTARSGGEAGTWAALALEELRATK
jgi:hypothetical protein